MALIIIRVVFLILSSVSGYVVVQNLSAEPTTGQAFQGVAIGLAVPAVIFALEAILRKYFVDAIAGIMFGVVTGFILSFITFQTLNLVTPNNKVLTQLQVPLTLIICYICVAIVLQTKDKFKFIIPYVDFRSGEKAPDFLIIDSSAVIDGRIFNLLKMRIFTEKVIIPQFVLDELQALSDSSDRLKREKGKRALNTVQKIREDIFLDIEVYFDSTKGSGEVDSKLIRLGIKINGRIATTDANLEKVAIIEDVQVLNIHEMACAFRVELIAGEQIEVEIMRKGEQGKGQGVGFLPDGTMVVVENGDSKIGKTVKIEVTNSVQTSSGKMIFSKMV